MKILIYLCLDHGYDFLAGRNNMDDLVLKIEDVGKDYMLGAVTGQTFKDAIRKKNKSTNDVFNKKFTALDNVSFEVHKGETIGLIGSNGAGKSTLLKLISRITAPTRGNIYINGKVASMLEVGTGFHPELTGRENIYLNGSILGMKKKEIDEKLDSIIDFSECGEFIDTPVKRYSSGMYVKLAFSVAAHLDSDIMIMDEVLAVGDIKFQHKCLNKMKEIARTQGRTIIYVSHNMDTIYKLCNRCIVMSHGQLVFDGSVNEATKLYMGVNTKTNHNADYTKYMRPGWLGRDDVRLTFAEYPDKSDNIVSDNNLRLSISWKCNTKVENVGMRVELMADDDKPFATSVFYNIFSGNKGDTGKNILNINLSDVMNGNYQTYYTLFCLDPYDESIDLDCVRGIDIIVEKEKIHQTLNWRNNSWGNIRI